MAFKKLSWFFILLILSFQNTQCQSIEKKTSNFVMFDESVYKATFILETNATPRTVETANELIKYLEKITGVKPQLLASKPKILPNNIVWIGNHPELKTIFPNINFELKQEEILIAANQNNLVIQGRDKYLMGLPKVVFKNNNLENYQEEYGTINAIYTFLQEYLEVRWFFPGELGEDVITKNKIAFKPFIYRYEPQIKARSGIFIKSRLGNNQKTTEIDVWSQRNRAYFSSTFFNAGHPFVDWWGKYKNTNPNIFALTTRLERAPLRDPKYVKLCVSNTEIDKLWLKEVEKEIERNPYTKIFSVNENDGYGSGFCVCENCKKLDHSSPLSDERNMSDRHLHFANRLALALQKKYPNKNYKVLYQAYGPDRPIPIKEKPSNDVIVSSVANFHMRRKTDHMMKDVNVIEYYNWSKIAKEQFWRPNLSNPVGKEWGLPDIALNQAFEDFKFVAQNGCSGLFFDSYTDHWSTQGPQFYIVAQLVWNPHLNKKQIIDEYYARMYGPATIKMAEYWNLIENTRKNHFEKYHQQHGRFFVHETYNSNWFIKVFDLIEQSLIQTSEKPEYKKYKQRIEFAKQGLLHAEKIVQIREIMSKIEADPKDDQWLLLLQKKWTELDDLKKKMNPLAINYGYVKYHRDDKNSGSYSRRMTGLIPNKPITKKILKELARENENLE